MKAFIFLIVFLTSVFIISCDKPGKCSRSQDVEFRSIKFTFPLTARNATRFPGKVSLQNTNTITNDSILPGISAKWYLTKTEDQIDPTDSLAYLKDATAYAITFYLFGDKNKSDEEIIAELNEKYHGVFEYYDQQAEEYYLFQDRCLSIILKRETIDSHRIPVLSFCYGFSLEHAKNWGIFTGQLQPI